MFTRISLCLLFLTFSHWAAAEDRPAAPPDAPISQKPLRVLFLAGQSNMVGTGSEDFLAEHHPELLVPRKDVFAVRWGVPSGPLRSGFGSRQMGFGPELTFGHVLGDELEEGVILVKAAWGGKDLKTDFRPPSAVAKRGGEVGPYYDLMMTRFAKALQHLETHVPEVRERGYELAGFVWFQGENDCVGKGRKWEEYEANLKDLIHDVRTTFGVPEMPVMIIQINKSIWGGDEPDPKTGEWTKGGHFVRKAQKEVAEADPHAAWALTSDLHQGYHYDAASYLTIGERAGKNMLPLLAPEIRDDRGSEAVKTMVKAYVLDRVAPPSSQAPDLESLSRGLFAYFPFDEGEGHVVTGAAPQPVTAVLHKVGKDENIWTPGVVGSGVRLKGQNLLTFAGFTEPLNDGGLIGDRTFSFWYQANTKRCFTRIGRGVGYRFKKDGSNWYYSTRANYAGWDIVHWDIDGPVAFTASFEEIGPRAALWGDTSGDGIKWTHIAITFDESEGDIRIWVDGKPEERQPPKKRRKPAPKDPFTDGGHGIVPADVPLTIGVDRMVPGGRISYDELCIWSRVLDDDEIRTLYNNGHAIDLPNDILKTEAGL